MERAVQRVDSEGQKPSVQNKLSHPMPSGPTAAFPYKLDAMGNDKKKWFIHTVNTFYNSKHKCAHMCQPSDVRPRPVPSIWICWEELCVFCLPKPHPLSTSLLSSKQREKLKAEPIQVCTTPCLLTMPHLDPGNGKAYVANLLASSSKAEFSEEQNSVFPASDHFTYTSFKLHSLQKTTTS